MSIIFYPSGKQANIGLFYVTIVILAMAEHIMPKPIVMSIHWHIFAPVLWTSLHGLIIPLRRANFVKYV